jgi:capsular polysaccharide biosynthesis protein
MQYTIMGVLLGGMIGVGFVILIEVLDKNIKYGKDVERILGIRLLGLIPDYDMKEGGK